MQKQTLKALANSNKIQPRRQEFLAARLILMRQHKKRAVCRLMPPGKADLLFSPRPLCPWQNWAL